MSYLGDTLVSIGQSLPETIRRRQEYADKTKREEDALKRQAILDAMTSRVQQAQLDRYDQEAAEKKAETERKASIYSGGTDTLNAFSKAIAEKQQAEKDKGLYGQISVPSADTLANPETAATPSLGLLQQKANISRPYAAETRLDTGETFNPLATEAQTPEERDAAISAGKGITQAGDTMAANSQRLGQSRLGMLAGAGGLKYADDPRVKNVLDYEQKAEENAATAAERERQAKAAREESNTFRSDEAQKTRDFQKQQSEDQRAFLKMMQDMKEHDKNTLEGIDPDTGKPYAAGKYVAAGYAFRANESNGIAEKLYNDGFDAGKVTNAVMNPDKLNLLKDPAQRQYSQAARNFVNSILRPESGAVIADSEFLNAYRQYFAQPGDDAATQEQKRLNRIQKIAGLKAQAGSAYDVVQKEFDTLSGKPAPTDKPTQPAASAAPHAQDSEAVTWAKQNPNDPRASKILKMNGL